MTTENPLPDGSRIGWLERPGDDFPYYNGWPVGLTGAQWGLVLVAVVIGFLGLVLGLGMFKGTLAGFIPVIFCAAVPLIALGLVSRGNCGALFRRLHWRDLGLMILLVVINLLVTLVVGLLVARVTETTSPDISPGG